MGAKKKAMKKSSLEIKVADLVKAVEEAMQYAVDEDCPAEDAPVYLAGRDIYALHVLHVLEALGIEVKEPR